MQVGLRQPIPLFRQLAYGDADKYVKAIVRNSENTQIAEVALSPVGPVGLYGNSQVFMPNSRFVVAQYLVYSDSDYSTLDTQELATAEQFNLLVVDYLNVGRLPNLNDAIIEWFQPMTFTKLVKTNLNYMVVESAMDFCFQGVWQPYNAKQLQLRPQGQRAWAWFTCHADPSLQLAVDDVIYYYGVQYRVMDLSDFSKYGFMKYHLVEDYTGSGPQ